MKRPKPRKGGTNSSLPPGSTREESLHHYNEGIQFFQHGQLALAASAFRKALSLNPDFSEAHNNLGNALIGLGKWKAAESSFRHALRFHPGNAMILANIGNALHHQDKAEEAIATLRESIRQDAHYAPAYYYLGNALLDLDQAGEAIENYKKALDIHPDSPEIQNRLGAALHRQGRHADAIAILHKTVKTNPRFGPAYLSLAEAACAAGAIDDAVKIYQTAATLEPDNDSVHGKLADVYFARQEYAQARAAIARAIRINPGKPEYIYRLGRTLFKLNLHAEAEVMLRKAVAMRPNHAGYHNSLGLALQASGKGDEACKSFRRAIRLQPDHVYAYANLAYTMPAHGYSEEMRMMEALLRNKDLPEQEQVALHFSLGASFDAIGDYNNAFTNFSEGNALKTRITPYQDDTHEGIRKIATIFSREFFQHHENSGFKGPTPIFITGLPRAGKTVVETILARHPLVTAGDESGDFMHAADEILHNETRRNFPDGAREVDGQAFEAIGKEYIARQQQRFKQASYVTNTSPGNAKYLGMIRLCLPDAKVIVCNRDARDTCTEIYNKDLPLEHYYSHDPGMLGSYYIQHQNLMKHWRQILPGFIHVIQFEEFISNPEAQIRALLSFCALPWDNACLNTESIPAPENILHVWEHYSEYLQPLFRILDS